MGGRTRFGSVHDLDPDHKAQFVKASGQVIGVEFSHIDPRVGRQCDASPVLVQWEPHGEARPLFTLTSEEGKPISVEPHISCATCGDRGWIKDGQWVPFDVDVPEGVHDTGPLAPVEVETKIYGMGRGPDEERPDTILPEPSVDEDEELVVQAVCRICEGKIFYYESPSGGWWSHEVHPEDEHDAEPSVPLVEVDFSDLEGEPEAEAVIPSSDDDADVLERDGTGIPVGMITAVAEAADRGDRHPFITASARGLEWDLKDSGHRREFDTGAQRDRAEGKGRYDLLQVLALPRIARILEKGAKKYEARNWERGMPLSVYLDSALRHLCQYIEGLQDEDHLGQAAWNLLSAMQTEEMCARGLLPTTLLDLPDYTGDNDGSMRAK